MNNKGQLIVFSGPSGVGKGTVLQHYLAGHPRAMVSVSATTRSPRPGEVDGVHYHFMSREGFEKLVADGQMLEHACYNGNYYGTPRAAVEAARAEGRDVVLEIEVQGALQVKKLCPDALLVFVLPPSWEELEHRLSGRGTEDAQTVAKRMAIAAGELPLAHEYDYAIVNDTVEQASARLEQIVEANRFTADNMNEFINEVSEHA